MNSTFEISRLPHLVVGEPIDVLLPRWLKEQGYTDVLLCVGKHSLEQSGVLDQLLSALKAGSIGCSIERAGHEPSPELVDTIQTKFFETDVQCVVGIGGGSVLDTAKAVSAMIAESRNAGEAVSVVNFLEGVGTMTPSGKRIGLVAVPTTAGTGSEATKNAVISRVGKDGFKKSLRHEKYIPDAAVLDGELAVTAPASVTTATGLDAVTQLLEAYVSEKASSFTDMMALEGLAAAGKTLPRIITGGEGKDPALRTEMAYAAYLSGACLANANLGVVHGAASVLGSMHAIPHGVVCGTLLREASVRIIAKAQQVSNDIALKKYSRAGFALAQPDAIPPFGERVDAGLQLLDEILTTWQETFSIARLSEYGFTEEELRSAAEKTGLKETPAELSTEDIQQLFTARL
ncbi:MAG: iron-containing alcohol dehydrogenase [Spirochaetota bacterium]